MESTYLKLWEDAIESNNLNVINDFLSNGLDPTIDSDYAIKKACENGFVKIVKILLADNRINTNTHPSLLVSAAYNDDSQMMELLLEDPRIKITCNDIMHCAANLRPKCLRVLSCVPSASMSFKKSWHFCSDWIYHSYSRESTHRSEYLEVVKILEEKRPNDPYADYECECCPNLEEI